MNFKSKKDLIKTLTLEECTERTLIDDLHKDTKQKLIEAGI